MAAEVVTEWALNMPISMPAFSGVDFRPRPSLHHLLYRLLFIKALSLILLPNVITLHTVIVRFLLHVGYTVMVVMVCSVLFAEHISVRL